MKKFLVISLLVLFSAGIFATSEINPDKTTPVATVNGEPITMYEFLAEVMPNYMEIAKKVEEVDPLFSEVLTSTEAGKTLLTEYEKRVLAKMIERKLFLQLAKQLDVAIDMQALKEKIHNIIIQNLKENNISIEIADLYYTLKGYTGGLEMYEVRVLNETAYRQTYDAIYQALTSDATVTEEEIVQYYKANKKIVLKIKGFDSFAPAYTFLNNAKASDDPVSLFDVEDREYTFENLIKETGISTDTAVFLFDEFKKGLYPKVISTETKHYVVYLSGEKSLEELRDEISKKLLEEKKKNIWNTFIEQYFVPFREQAIIEVGEIGG
ncbi:MULTISPECIES: SurA N-terminal domain-containing protein [Kosmotoga]|jgi:hypothetical protein|uniref:PpiC domain-containing protein n=1 Tax=Kosmotoga olearia (strain ATCC BAA-1733 / DSM 21960 / TBF 19.5.1) TaxID=521045 RepID=C5CGC8_KOSOT|nr:MULTISPECIES: SurA N-terminal domain-containing protein [Kosmotoga]ACR79569.1 hypothetical protein Kole_0859 [Kosmotoga olearia TBF 19.5.1]MDI3523917.1 hypothetical protein [Kosmotoga sp.]MDK2953304.1 hypothetical protein [Kosmotoga sp.]